MHLLRCIRKLPEFMTYHIYDKLLYWYFDLGANFYGWGVHLFTGKFGKGKTSYMMMKAYDLCCKYPQLSILTNIKVMNFPEWTNILKLETAQDILDAPENCLVLIDEIGTIFNSRDFSGGKCAVPKPLFQHLCQCRKRKLMIFGTVQRFNLLDKQIRDISATVSSCATFFAHPFSRMITVWKYDIDEYEKATANATYIPAVESKDVVIQSNQSRNLYDTSELVDNMLQKEYLDDEEILRNQEGSESGSLLQLLDKKQQKQLRRPRRY